MPTRRQLLAGASALTMARAAFASTLQDERAGDPRGAYDLASGVTYLNHASIGTVPRIVREAHARYLEVCESNPWLHVWGDAWTETIEEVHVQAAEFLGCPEDDVALMRSTTEAFGLAANGLELDEGSEVLFGSLNHIGASASWEHAAKARGYTVRRFRFPEESAPALSADDVAHIYVEALSERTRVLVLPHVDNVVGFRHPVREIARLARERGVRWICVDGAQSVGMHPVSVDELDVDLYATSAHKWLQAPKGTGVMALSTAMREKLRPLVVTWGQARWRGTAREYTDFGTRDLPRILALGDAIRFQEAVEDRGAHHETLFRHARARVDSHPRLSWRSPGEYENGAALFAVGLEGASAGELAASLFEEHGFVVRPFEGGSRNHLRVSPNTMNDERDLDRFFDRVEAAL